MELELLSTLEAATLLGMTHQGVHRLAKAGVIGKQVGKTWVFTRAEVEAYRDRPHKVGRTAGSKIGSDAPTLVVAL